MRFIILLLAVCAPFYFASASSVVDIQVRPYPQSIKVNEFSEFKTAWHAPSSTSLISNRNRRCIGMGSRAATLLAIAQSALK
jgi:hypothetical protein